MGPIQYVLEEIGMRTTLRMERTVLPGHRLEISDPELPEGAKVKVVIELPPNSRLRSRFMLEYLKTLPPGPVLFQTPDDAKRYVQEERASWDR